MEARPFNLQGWVQQDATFVGWQYLVNIENVNTVEVRNVSRKWSEHRVADFHVNNETNKKLRSTSFSLYIVQANS